MFNISAILIKCSQLFRLQNLKCKVVYSIDFVHYVYFNLSAYKDKVEKNKYLFVPLDVSIVVGMLRKAVKALLQLTNIGRSYTYS